MSDRYVYSCRDCHNAVVSGVYPPTFACPVCGMDDQMNWRSEAQIR